ncbi:MAG: GNAT family N-acetyltransferase [Alphaproteobacteria bacterium]
MGAAIESFAVAAGRIASIVTSLEMRRLPPPDRASLARDDLRLERVARPQPGFYRDLQRRVGARWLWFSRLRLSDEALMAILDDPAVELYVLRRLDRPGDGPDAAVGIVELDRRQPGQVELAFLGVTEDLLGQGAGRFMIASAIEIVRDHNCERFWVHTCTLDHPAAIRAYERAGFRAFARSVEITDDPRLDGTLPADAAPHVPLIAPDGPGATGGEAEG